MLLRRHWRIIVVSIVLSTAAGITTALVVEDAPAARQATSIDLTDVAVSFEGRTAQWVQDENRRQGADDWRLDPRKARGIQGFADAASAVQGDAVTFFVSTSAPHFQLRAYRLGWYDGAGARLVWQSASLTGNRQPEPLTEPRTGMVEADWTPSATVRITSEFVPGIYLFKVVGAGGEQVHVPLVVRDPLRTASVLILDAATARTATSTGRVWSFDRPADATAVVRDELPVIALVERAGLDVAYAADIDVHRSGAVLQRHRSVVLLGHDGYWAVDMRGWLRNKSAVLLGPAAPTRDVRFEDSPVGFDRRMADAGPSEWPPHPGRRVASRDLSDVADALAALP